MKNPKQLVSGKTGFLPKIDLKVKISFLFLVSALFQLQAGSESGKKTKIDLVEKGATVLEVIAAIESKTDYKFFYSSGELDLERTLDISVKQADIEQILNRVFARGKVGYRIIDTQIILTPYKMAKTDDWVGNTSPTSGL